MFHAVDWMPTILHAGIGKPVGMLYFYFSNYQKFIYNTDLFIRCCRYRRC